jgi:hypothetical protein
VDQVRAGQHTKNQTMDCALSARGRIQDSPEGRVTYNRFGHIDGARLASCRRDGDRCVVTIRLDHSGCPGFWAEVDLPLQNGKPSVDPEQRLCARGRVQDRIDDQIVYNRYGKIDGARLVMSKAGIATLRLDHSECLGFWAEVELPLQQLQRFVDES